MERVGRWRRRGSGGEPAAHSRQPTADKQVSGEGDILAHTPFSLSLLNPLPLLS